MVAFFQNIWAWLASHASVIAGILTPANLVLIVGTIVQLIRQRKTITANTGSSVELKASLNENKRLLAEIDSMKEQMTALHEQNTQLQDGMTQCVTKLNCVLEVQGQAYSVSLAKTKTLDVINGIIADGKYAETNSRRAIVDEVAEMREQLEKLTAASKKSEAKVKKIAGVVEQSPVVQGESRYD